MASRVAYVLYNYVGPSYSGPRGHVPPGYTPRTSIQQGTHTISLWNEYTTETADMAIFVTFSPVLVGLQRLHFSR